MEDALPTFPLTTAGGHSRNENASSTQARAGNATECGDEELMIAFSRGSGQALDELFARYKQPLFGFFRRRVYDTAQAEELTQECFIVLIRASRNYKPSASFRTYLYAIAFRISQAHRRKEAFRATFFGDREAGREPDAQHETVAALAVREAVNKLDRSEREILLLREFEGLSYAEIATVLTLPLNTVRSRLFRARLALRDLLVAPARSAGSTHPNLKERT